MIDAAWAFAQYEEQKSILPKANFPSDSKHVSGLSEIAHDFDVFLLDAYGVLNIGGTAIAGVPERMAALQKLGKQLYVLTNGASVPPEYALQKYRSFGYDFKPENIIASRVALKKYLSEQPKIKWGVMAPEYAEINELCVDATRLVDDPSQYDFCEGFILLGSELWHEDMQSRLIETLIQNPRPVLVGNPDIVAPCEGGFSLEPGWFAKRIREQSGIQPIYFGKPFQNVYEMVLSQIDPSIPRDRILMVGDTLHTDIIGGAAAGVKTALITGHGLFAGEDVQAYIDASGIVPDYISKDP